MAHARQQHPNAVLTPTGRRRMVACVVEQGWTIEATAERFQVDAKTVRKWRDRFLPKGSTGCTIGPAARIPRTRHRQRCSDGWSRCVAGIGGALLTSATSSAWPPSTVQAILRREGLGRLDRGDRATATEPPRRYQRDRPGELVHVDVKKLSGIPTGGGWRIHGRGQAPPVKRSTRGYRFIHTAIDDRTRLAYSEILDDEQAITAAGFWQRAHAWFAAHGITHRTSPDRQRLLLPLNAVARRLADDRRDPETNPSLPAPDERQGGALPPHPARGMGLHPALAHRPPTHPRLRRVHPLLQSPPFPRRARLVHTHRHPHRLTGDNLPAQHS